MKTVTKIFPTIDTWTGVAHFTIRGDVITPEVFETMLTKAGVRIGIGAFRPERGGTRGQFRPTKFEWNIT
jgi:hypothetical protein